MESVNRPDPQKGSLDLGSMFCTFTQSGITEEGASGAEGLVSDRLIREGRIGRLEIFISLSGSYMYM